MMFFFGIGGELKELVPSLNAFWPELSNKMHIDSWREITKVDGHRIIVKRKDEDDQPKQTQKLFFVNLGGYKEDDMEEYHYKQVVVAEDLAEAIKKAKKAVFWKHHISSHIDDKYGIDVDDVYEIDDLLMPEFKDHYDIKILANDNSPEDTLQIGYLKISKLLNE